MVVRAASTGHNGAMPDPVIAFAAAGPPPPPPPPLPAGPPPGQAWQMTEPDRQRDMTTGQVAGYAVAVTPLALLVLLAVLAPNFLSPLFDDRVSLVGTPAGFWFVGIVLLLAAIGVATVRVVRHPVLVGAVLLVTTFLGLNIVLLGPAVILIMINLKT
jgi:hypothetical protein